MYVGVPPLAESMSFDSDLMMKGKFDWDERGGWLKLLVHRHCYYR